MLRGISEFAAIAWRNLSNFTVQAARDEGLAFSRLENIELLKVKLRLRAFLAPVLANKALKGYVAERRRGKWANVMNGSCKNEARVAIECRQTAQKFKKRIWVVVSET